MILFRGREFVTLKDVGHYITKLAKAEHEAPEWLAAAQALDPARDVRRADDAGADRHHSGIESTRRTGV
jgi:hypothetical protein